jgi:hypothetical protein
MSAPLAKHEFVFGAAPSVATPRPDDLTGLAPFRWTKDRYVGGEEVTVEVPFPVRAVTVGPLSQFDEYRLRSGGRKGIDALYRVTSEAPLFLPMDGPVQIVPARYPSSTEILCRSDLVFWPYIPAGYIATPRPSEHFFGVAATITTSTSVPAMQDDGFAREIGNGQAYMIPAWGRARSRFQADAYNVILGAASEIEVKLYGGAFAYNLNDPDGELYNVIEAYELLKTWSFTATGDGDVFFNDAAYDVYYFSVASIGAAPSTGQIRVGADLWSR